eukprot:376534_1
MGNSKISARFLLLCVMLLIFMHVSLASFARRNRRLQKDVNAISERERTANYYLKAGNFGAALNAYDDTSDMLEQVNSRMEDHNLDFRGDYIKYTKRIKPNRKKARRGNRRKTKTVDRLDLEDRTSRRKGKSIFKTVVIIFLMTSVVISIAVFIVCYIMCFSDPAKAT